MIEPSNYPERDRQTTTNTQNLIIPTETEVWQFLQDECKVDISEISIRPPFDQWWNMLHEGSHYAIKPPSYLTTSPSHPFQKNGLEQLKSVGIDVNQGIFRPTKEIKIIGLQPIVGWDFPQSA